MSEYREMLDYNTTIDREEHHGPLEIAIDMDGIVLREKDTINNRNHYIAMDHAAFDLVIEKVNKFRAMQKVMMKSSVDHCYIAGTAEDLAPGGFNFIEENKK